MAHQVLSFSSLQIIETTPRFIGVVLSPPVFPNRFSGFTAPSKPLKRFRKAQNMAYAFTPMNRGVVSTITKMY
jgi:hypothetical protein